MWKSKETFVPLKRVSGITFCDQFGTGRSKSNPYHLFAHSRFGSGVWVQRQCITIRSNSTFEMLSAIDASKRALVTLMRTLAGVYGVLFSVTRDSADSDIRSAYPPSVR